jgi:PAS domain S-box-containing protein
MQSPTPEAAALADELHRLRERVAQLEQQLAQPEHDRPSDAVRSQQSLAFLAEASAILASSLDYEETLAHLARVSVPQVADWCAIDLLDASGSIERLAVAHVDPARVELAHEIARRWPVDPSAPTGVPNVIRTGQPEVAAVITEEMVRAGIPDPELRDMFLAIGLSSLMVVPLIARGRALGALTLAAAESRHHFTDGDLRLAQDLANRAAIAVDNARLHRELLQFRSTLDRTLDCVFMFDAETLRFFYVNQGAVEQVGYSTDELMAMTPLDIKPRFDEEAFRAMIAPLIAGEQPVLNFETVHRHKQGRDLPVEISLQYVDPPEGDPRFVAVVRDITARSAAELALRASEERYRALADAMPLVVWTGKPDGTVDYYNQRWYDYTGLSLEETYGWGWDVVIHPDDRQRTVDAWSSSMRTGSLYEIEYRWKRGADQSYRWWLGRALPVRDEQGAISYWVGTGTDIHDQKRAEAALRESEQRYRVLADSMPLLIWMADPQGEMLSTNQPWRDYTGLDHGELGAEGWARIVHPDDIPLTAERWAASVATGQPFEIEQRVRGVDGGYRWHLVRALPVRDEDGAVAYWVGTNTNIDDQKRYEATLREQAESLAELTGQLEARNRELDQFAYITSHDLKAPLRGIANLAQWIEEDLGEHATAEIRQQLELLRGRAHRMEALIEGILQYSRVGRVGEQPQLVDVAQLLDDVVDLLALPAGQVSVEPGMPTLRAERVPLQQVFHNLIGNALKHGGPDVQVQVRCEQQGDRYRFSVSDNGPGIAPQYHERIFGIFQTLASRDRVEGSGLGLALVKKIVESRGGRVTVDSDEGRGATFCFTWPLDAARATARR